MTGHKYKLNDLVLVKSGKLYRVDRLCMDNRPYFKGAPGYHIVQWRNGRDYGPVRVVAETSLRPEGGNTEGKY
jgi:hypothetical protein